MGGTSEEEIARQHQEALELVRQNIMCQDSLDFGEISLSQKQHPTEVESTASTTTSSREEKKEDTATTNLVCVSSRGRVDVSALASLVREGYDDKAPERDSSSSDNSHKIPSHNKTPTSTTNLWDEANAAVNNVRITRPSHDAWGIKKIVMVFCDDFLQDVYELPWWHARNDIRQAVQPILDTLHIQPDQIVRLLLAALPPGVTIPIHHDTGEWVKHTHRVHVPVLVSDPSKILFRCGPTVATMQRVDCTPGHVFEINNQGKHAVSNCGDDHRVHLILDYVDEQYSLRINRIRLNPGERILQTRRSIDRLVDKGKRPTPSFLILGAQKAGTTSLYESMTQHPLVVRAKRRETHCLDWRWNTKLKSTKQRRSFCHKFYYTQELSHYPSCMTGDSTPSYLLDSYRVIPRVKEVFDWPLKFLVMLRDPVQRAHSHYAMVTSLDGTPQQIQTRGTEWRDKSFEQVVMEDMRRMKSCGLIPYWNIDNGTTDQAIFDDFVGSNAEMTAWNKYLQDVPLNTGSYSPVSRGMYELNLRPWLDAFEHNQFLVLRMEDMKKDGGVQVMLDKVWRHLELPPYDVNDDSAKNTRDYEPMDPDIRAYLQRFYKSHNRRLAEMLGSEWKDAWSYNDR